MVSTFFFSIYWRDHIKQQQQQALHFSSFVFFFFWLFLFFCCIVFFAIILLKQRTDYSKHKNISSSLTKISLECIKHITFLHIWSINSFNFMKFLFYFFFLLFLSPSLSLAYELMYKSLFFFYFPLWLLLLHFWKW